MSKGSKKAAQPKKKSWLIEVRKALRSADRAAERSNCPHVSDALYYINGVQKRLRELLEDHQVDPCLDESTLINMEDSLEVEKGWRRLECGYWEDPVCQTIHSPVVAYRIATQRGDGQKAPKAKKKR